MNGIKASRFGLSGVLFFVLSTILGGLLFPGYSHKTQLISESYAIGTAYGLHLRYIGFLPSGIFFAAFAFFATRAIPASKLGKWGFYSLGIFYGIATIIVSFFPCDTGCNPELIDPSISQLIHNLTGLLTYLIVPLSLVLIGIAAQKWPGGKLVSYAGILCGLIALFFVGTLSSDMETDYAGLYQRIIEGSILLWITLCSFYLRKINCPN